MYYMEADRKDAEAALTQWATRTRADMLQRDQLVLNALAAGASKNRIHVLTGIARTTIDRIIYERERRMGLITLYETNSDLVCAQQGDGPVWDFGPVTPDMYGKFAEDAAAWCDGDWEPSENDGQSIVSTTDGLRSVAEWDSKTRQAVCLVPEESLGGAARLYLGEND